jgi:NADH-quinone oxidoreductase subunit C
MSDTFFKSVTPLMVEKSEFSKTGIDYSIFLDSSDLTKAASEMMKKDFYLEDVSAADFAEGYLLTYHFSGYSKSERIALRVVADHDSPEVPTISTVYQGADWHERECFDFFGIRFTDHPNLIPLLLDPDGASAVLCKEEKDRKEIADLIISGDIVFKRDDFSLLDKSESADENVEA